MKVNRNSWHYKLNMLDEFRPSNNLCNYFWRCFFKVILPVITVILILCLITMLIFLFFTEPEFVFTVIFLLYIYIVFYIFALVRYT